MTRENKRKLSIGVSVVGVILLVIIIFTSNEFKALFASEAKSVEFNITDEQNVALNKFEYYDEGIIAVKARNNWQKHIAKELGISYEVWGEKAYGEKTLLYGGIDQEISQIVYGKEQIDTVYDSWLAMLDENDKVLWVNVAGNGYDHEKISDVIVKDNIITVIGHRWETSLVHYSEVLFTQYSMEGEKLTFEKTGVYGKPKLIVPVENEYYVFVDEETGMNDAIYRILDNGTSEKVYVCADKEKNERYTITSMCESDGKLYLSGYSRNVKNYNLPRQELKDDFFFGEECAETRQNENGKYYTYLIDSKLNELRAVYEAVLFEYDIQTGECVEIDRIDERIGEDIKVNESNELVWNVEYVKVVVRPTPFDIMGATEITVHYYDKNGELLRAKKSDELGMYVRPHLE